jgi:hypothetical protein
MKEIRIAEIRATAPAGAEREAARRTGQLRKR